MQLFQFPETFQVTSDFGRKVDLDLSTQALHYQQRMFPVGLMFDTQGFMQWKMGYAAHHGNNADAMMFLMRFEQEIWLRFQQFKVPAIELTQDTPREAVCQVFEKVNTGGVTLTVFELMTATFAANDFLLRENWEARRGRFVAKHDVLSAVDGTAFLTAVTLLASYERHLTTKSAVSCKRADVLRLELDDFKQLQVRVEAGFKKAAELLAEEKIFEARGLPYATQLIPLQRSVPGLAIRFRSTAPSRSSCGGFGAECSVNFMAAPMKPVLGWICRMSFSGWRAVLSPERFGTRVSHRRDCCLFNQGSRRHTKDLRHCS
jgi:hypothetical protein